MHLLVTIHLQGANIAAFEDYEAQVLALLPNYGAAIIERLRAANGQSEFHLLHFPDADSLAAFQSDPIRASLQSLWQSSGASATVTQVTRHF